MSDVMVASGAPRAGWAVVVGRLDIEGDVDVGPGAGLLFLGAIGVEVDCWRKSGLTR